MLVAISAPPDNDRGPIYTEQAMGALHQAGVPFMLQFGQHAHTVGLYCRFRDRDFEIVHRQFASHYHGCTITRIPEDSLALSRHVGTLHLSLRSDCVPIRMYGDFEERLTQTIADPLNGILAMLVPSSGLRTRIDIAVRPARSFERLRLRKRVATLRPHNPAAENKAAEDLFAVRIALHVSGAADRRAAVRRKLRELSGAFGQFTPPQLATRKGWRRHRWRLFAPPSLLSPRELATLWHPATKTVRAAKLEMTASRQLEPPAMIPLKERERQLAVLGRVAFGEQAEEFGVRDDDRFRHLAVIGKTGMGKSTLLYNLIASDIDQGRGVAVIDPHGDLADAIIQAVPSRRTNDVVVFDAGDREFPLAFNPMAVKDAAQRPLVASGIVSALKMLYGDSWGPRLEHILRHGLLALLETPGTTLLSLLRLLGDADYRDSITDRVQDPVVRDFWTHEFAGWNERYRTEAVAPIQNKIGQFLSIPAVRGIIGQSRSTLNLRDVMDDGRILIVNLSKGKIGDDASNLLGSLLVTGLQLAAMSRADIAEAERRSFYAFVDEFQNFATGSFATILSEARKYRLALTIANQYIAQMSEATAAAVFGNVGSLMVFNVGPSDATVLAEQLAGDVRPADLMTLPKYTAYVRLLIDGQPSRAFSMRTLPPAEEGSVERAAIVRKVSRQRYAKPADQVAGEIERAFVHA